MFLLKMFQYTLFQHTMSQPETSRSTMFPSAWRQTETPTGQRPTYGRRGRVLPEFLRGGVRGAVGLWLAVVLAWPAAADSVRALPDLPQGLASFGAAVAGDELYVYGGHVGRTHQHSVQNLFHRFLKLDLTAPDHGWQDLGAVEGLQGLPLISDGQRLCRIGGLQARNHQDAEDEDLHSVDDVACFDIAAATWRSLPPLPQPRSSHDAVWVGDRLYVVGGWQLRGAGQESVWQDTLAVLDTAAAEPGWQTVPQPFRRRALAVASAGGKIYAFGGLGEDGTSRAVDIFDTADGTWSRGPDLPEMQQKRMKGFGVSAFGVGDRVYLSGADGVVHSLEAAATQWTTGLGRLETPRFFHRLLHHDDRLLFVAGAARSGHLRDTETVSLTSLVPGSVVPDSEAVPKPQTADETPVEAATPPPHQVWSGFRGSIGNGHGGAADVPIRWSKDEHLSWRAALPGYGQSAPVVWQGQVFVTSIEGANKETLILSSLAVEDGEVLWRRRFAASQTGESSDMVSRGAPTPVVDGNRLYVFWESGDVVALDHHGETLWRRSLTEEFGAFAGNHGVAGSPVLTDSALVVHVAHEGPSYFIAMDPATGATRWKVDRPSKVAWTTPTVVRHGGLTQLVSSAAGRVEGLDAATGEQLWVLEGIEKNHVPSVVVDGDLVVVPSSQAGQSLAVRLGGRGTLGDDDVVWRVDGATSGFASPLVQGNCVLMINKAGVLHCIDRGRGDVRWRHRLAEALWASPVAIGEHLFFFGKQGQTTVLTVDDDGPHVVAENTLPTEETVYGVAAAADSWFIRSGMQIVRVAD